MNCSLENYLQFVAPHLSHQLVSPEALSHIQTVARMLPPLSEALLECRLGANAPTVDFSVLATASDGSRDILAVFNSAMTLPDIILTNPVWKCIRDFCIQWHAPTSLLSENVDHIWLEFNVNGQPPPVPIPSFFFRLKNIQTDAQLRTTETALSLLFGGSI